MSGPPGAGERRNAFDQPIGAALPGWQPRERPAREAMRGRTCDLQPLDAQAHAEALYRAFAEAAAARDWTYLPDEPPRDPAAYRAEVQARSASADPLHFAVVVAGEPLGTLALMRIDATNGAIEIGHVNFAPRLQRTPAATEAVALLMRRAFDGGYRRLEWKCDSLNAPSRRAADRLGFTFEGVFRQAVVVKGRNRDTAWYGLVDRDWPRVREALDRWLDPANFDGDGRQRRALADLRATGCRSAG